ncbi:MAG: hypothetical protein Fur002_26620 [Anaerolineales bacterium]
MSESFPSTPSPAWGRNTKLIAGLTLAAMTGALLIKFQFILSPLFLSLLLAYLLYPSAEFFYRRLRFSWHLATGVTYLLFVALALTLLTWGGVAVVQQGQSALASLQNALNSLSQWTQDVSAQPYTLGGFVIDLSPYDGTWLSQKASESAQTLITEAGALLGSLASGAANFFGWAVFVVFVSYFIAAESGGLRSDMVKLNLPGYEYDIARLTREISRIWNSFLRGQITLFFLTIVIYAVLLEALGVQYAITLAVISGLARFLPYVGPVINWGILILIALFQESQIFGLSPLYYALLVLLIVIMVDMVIDYMITPSIYADTLSVHPAALLVAAIIAASLFGLLGVVVSAPVFASATLFWKYITRKILDIDPWLNQPEPPSAPVKFSETLRALFVKLAASLPKKK